MFSLPSSQRRAAQGSAGCECALDHSDPRAPPACRSSHVPSSRHSSLSLLNQTAAAPLQHQTHRAGSSLLSTHQQPTTHSVRPGLPPCPPVNESPAIRPKRGPSQENPHQSCLAPSRSLHCYLHQESLHREEVKSGPFRALLSVPGSVKQAMPESGLHGSPHRREPTHCSKHLRWSGARLVHHHQSSLPQRTMHPKRRSNTDEIHPPLPPNLLRYQESRPKLKSAGQALVDPEAHRSPASGQAER